MRKPVWRLVLPALFLALCLAAGYPALREGGRFRQETENGPAGEPAAGEEAENGPGRETASGEETENGPGREPASGEEAENGPGREPASGEEAENGPGRETASGEEAENRPEEEGRKGRGEEKGSGAAVLHAGLPDGFAPGLVPSYEACEGAAWAEINGDIPFFSGAEMEEARRLVEAGRSFQAYGELDGAGRCTGAFALVGPETLPQEERESIGMVKPTGWHTVKYDGIDGNYLYNRCHLVGFQLTGQNANEKNLVTGTRYLNIEGMLPFEDSVLAYVQGTGKHVLYRATPVFSGKNLLADGVLLEARSVEDPLVQFCAFCYNIQPGIEIDYASGESRGPSFTGTGDGTRAFTDGGKEDGTDGQRFSADENAATADTVPVPDAFDASEENARSRTAEKKWDYIVNVNTGKFHLPACASVEKIRERNRQGFRGTREELVEMGYQPCARCRP